MTFQERGPRTDSGGPRMKSVRYVHMKERHPTGIGLQNSQFLQHMDGHVNFREHNIRHHEMNFRGKARFGYLSVLASRMAPLKKSNDEILHAGDFSLVPFYSDDFDIIEVWDTMPFEEFYNYQSDYISAFNTSSQIPNTLKAKLIVVHSKDTYNHYKSFFGAQSIEIIPGAIDTNLFRIYPYVKKEPRSILAVASYYPQKNLFGLIKGCVIASQEKPIILRLIGRMRDLNVYQYISKIATEFPSLDFEFLGYVDEHKLIFEYNRASIYCSASLKEGFGLTPIEAMACGTLPVVSRIPSHVEILDNHAVYFDPSDEEDMAKSINFAFEQEPKLLDLRIAALHYSWQEVIPKWLKLYSSFGVDIN